MHKRKRVMGTPVLSARLGVVKAPNTTVYIGRERMELMKLIAESVSQTPSSLVKRAVDEWLVGSGYGTQVQRFKEKP